MKKLLSIIFFFITIILFLGSSFVNAIEVSVGAGFLKPYINITSAGDIFFGEGSGNEMKEIIGISSVGSTYFLNGNVRLQGIKFMAIELGANYWSKTEKRTLPMLDNMNVSTTFRNISFEANAVFLHRKYALVPFYGGGVALHVLNITIKPEEFPESGEKATKIKPGIVLFAGLEKQIKHNMKFFVSMRFENIPGWDQWLLNANAGIRFNLFCK